MTTLILKIISYVLVLLSFIFIYRSFLSLDMHTLNSFITVKNILIMFVFSIIYSINSLPFALAWRKMLSVISGKLIPVKIVINLYFKSNIAKYLPGNVFHFAGRHLLINEGLVSHTHLLFANLSEIGLLMLSSGIVVLSGILSGSLQIPDKVLSIISFRYIYMGSIFFLTTGAGVIFVLYKRNKLDIFNQFIRLINRKNILQIFLSALLYSIMYLTTGIILYMLIYTISPHVFSVAILMSVIFIFTLAWVCGYIVPGAPGGVGVREAILIIMLSVYFDESIIVVSSMILRIITVIGDVLTYLFSNIKMLQYKHSGEKA